MVFTFMVNGQWLLPKSIIPKLVQNTVEQYTLQFIMDESWAPFTAISAAFSNDENTCEVLVKDGCALIPTQMLTQCGRLDVALKGLYNERVYRTQPFHFRVAESAADENTEAFTPALAQQVQELAQNTYAVVAGLGDSLETQRRADAAVLTAEQSAKSASQNAQSAQDAAERALVSVDTVHSAQESADAAAAAAQASCESASASADRAAAAAQAVRDLPDRVSALKGASDQLKEDITTLKKGGIECVDVTLGKWISGYRITGYTTVDGRKVPNISAYTSAVRYVCVDIADFTEFVSNQPLKESDTAYTPIMITDENDTWLIDTSRKTLVDGTFDSDWLKIEKNSDGEPLDYKLDVEQLKIIQPTSAKLYICTASSEDSTFEFVGKRRVLGLADIQSEIDAIESISLKHYSATDDTLVSEIADGLPNVRLSSYDTNTRAIVRDSNSGFFTWKLDVAKIEKIESNVIFENATAKYFAVAFTDEYDTWLCDYVPGSTTATREWIDATSGKYIVDVDKVRELYPFVKTVYFCVWKSKVATNYWTVKGREAREVPAKDGDDLEIILPNELHLVVGHEYNIYHENILRCDNADAYAVSWRYIKGSLTYNSAMYADCLRITPTSPQTTYAYVTVAKKHNNKPVATKKVKFTVVADTQYTGKKVLFIGDSLTDRDVPSAEIQYVLSHNGIESIGTLENTVTYNGQTYTVKNEGRAGWASYDYTQNAEFAGYTNPFLNPSTNKFDFAYYMDTNGFETVDVICICLGTNGGSLGDAAMDEMIASIREWSSTVPIVISLINLPATQDGVGQHDLYLQKIAQLRNDFLSLNKYRIDKYENGEDANVGVAEVYVNLDCHNDYDEVSVPLSARNPKLVSRQNNNVHPSTYGYLKFADIYYNTIMYWLQK